MTAVAIPVAPWSIGLRGLGWTGLASVTGLVIRLGSNLLLTRLLAPQAYALLGTAMTVLTLLEWLSDLGIQPALVRHPRGDEPIALLTGWWMGLGRALGLSLLGLLLAWPTAWATGQLELVAIVACLAIRPALLALRSPAFPLLRRDMRFRDLFLDEVTMTAAGTGISVLLAWWTGSVWALVGGTLAGTLAVVVLSYVLVPQTPRLAWDREIAADLTHFGTQVLLNTLVMALWLNLDRLIGVRLAGLEAMGCYFVAWNLASAAEGLLTRACDVQFSLLSRQAEAARIEQERRLLDRLTSVLMPIGAACVALAPLVCRALYDDRYAATGWMLALLGVRLMVRTPGQLRFQGLLAQGRIGASIGAYAVALLVQTVLVLTLGTLWGAAGIATATVLSTLAWTLVQTVLAPGHGWREGVWLSRTVGWAMLGLAGAWMFA